MMDEHKAPAKRGRQRVAGRILIVLLLVSTVLLAFHIGFKYVSVVGYGEKHQAIFEVSNRFDMNNESSVPQWFTHLGFLGMAVLSGLAAYVSKPKRLRRFWWIVSGIAILLSVDDIATLHETLLQIIHVSVFSETPATLLQNAWLLLLPVILLIGIWLLWTAIRVLPGRTTMTLTTGGILYLLGAVMMDSVINTLSARSFAEQGIAAGIEGFLQLVGQSILIYALLEYIELHHRKVVENAIKALKV